MLDLFHLPSSTGNADVQTFIGDSPGGGVAWRTWTKPRGKSMCDIFIVGKGGNGGSGAIGANSTAAGGGGGGSGSQCHLVMPLALLPDTLYLSLAGQTTAATFASFICIVPDSTSGLHCLVSVNGGANGGNAAGATAGAAGAGGANPAASAMALGWAFAQAIAGQAGIIGGVAVAGGPISTPATGLLVTGGTGGGGLPAAAAVGTNGGSITGSGILLTVPGGLGSTVATNPAGLGTNGIRPFRQHIYGLGGTGSGSTHGTATTTGLVQSPGGSGMPGCGAGGMGGALTGSTAAVIALGGPSFAIITCW